MPAGMGLALGVPHSLWFIRELFIGAVVMAASWVKANGQFWDRPPNLALRSHRGCFIPGWCKSGPWLPESYLTCLTGISLSFQQNPFLLHVILVPKQSSSLLLSICFLEISNAKWEINGMAIINPVARLNAVSVIVSWRTAPSFGS